VLGGIYAGQTYAGGLLVLLQPGDPTVTVTTTPAAALVTITVDVDLNTGELDVYRIAPSGAISYVRGALGIVTNGLLEIEVEDYEAPFGVPVEYVAVARGGTLETESDPVEATLAVDVDWLNDLDDPVNNSGPVTVESFDELSYDTPQGVHRPLGRRDPVVTSDVRWTPAGRLVIVTETAEESRKIRDACGSGAPLLFRTPPDRGVGSMFLVPTKITERRVSRLATYTDRRWTLEVLQVARPDPELFAAPAGSSTDPDWPPSDA
jgi:hypothetical protein